MTEKMIRISNKEDQYARSIGSEERARSFPANTIGKGHSVASTTDTTAQVQITLPTAAAAEVIAAQSNSENKG